MKRKTVNPIISDAVHCLAVGACLVDPAAGVPKSGPAINDSHSLITTELGVNLTR